jgi:hypothetical protein
MALLKGRIALLALFVLCSAQAACDEHPTLHRAALELSTQDCDTDNETREPCRPEVAPETVEGRVFISRQDSTHAPEGVYLFLELVRASGVRVLVEVDLPTNTSTYRCTHQRVGRVSYREYRRGRLVFSSSRATGRIEIPEGLLAPTDGCAGGVGFAELRFTAPGLDGKLGTADDPVRRISRARFGDQAQVRGQDKELTLADPVEVVVTRCPAASSTSINEDDGVDVEVSAGCGFDDGGSDPGSDDSWDWSDSEGSWGGDDSGWEGDSWDDDGSDSGWEGDSWDDDGSDSGWEGDSWDDGGSDDSGWEGDSWDDDGSDDSGWEGDSWDASPPPEPRPHGAQARMSQPRRPPRSPRPAGPALSFLMLGTLGGLLRTRDP